jgi:soluble lytic murein transglycosylase-like protein
MNRILALVILVAGTILTARATERDPEAEYYASAYADHYGFPRALVYALIDQESGWDSEAVSSAGAMGLMQLMPATAQRFGVRNAFSKSDNIGGGARYLDHLLRIFHGDLRLVVAAYYAGEDLIGRRGLSLGNPQVIAYVEQVRRRYLRELQFNSRATQEEHR